MSRALTIDMAVTIQGNTPEELPERVLCQTRFVMVDFRQLPTLVEDGGSEYHSEPPSV